MPGRTASRTSQGLRRAGQESQDGSGVCGLPRNGLGHGPSLPREVESPACSSATSSASSTRSRPSIWPSRGTTSACRSASKRRRGPQPCSSPSRPTTTRSTRRERLGCGLVLAHHPLIFSPLERLTEDSTPGRLALRAARDGLAVVVAHTNLDKAKGGLADVVAGMLGLEATQPLQPTVCRLAQASGLRAARRRRPGAQGAVLGRRRRDRRVRALLVVGRAGKAPSCPPRAPTPAVGQVGRDQTTEELRARGRLPAAPAPPRPGGLRGRAPLRGAGLRHRRRRQRAARRSAWAGSACCRPRCRWRPSPPTSRPCCVSRRCATPATAPAWCAASPCCPARAARPSPPAWARSPTCSSPAT